MAHDYGEAGFRIHNTGSPNKGSKLANLVLVVVILIAAGAGYYVFAETPRLVQHIAAEDGLATASAHALAIKGAPLPDGAVPVLKKALDQGGSASLRAAAAKALAVTKSKDVVAELGDAATRDPDAEVRAAAVTALGDNDGDGFTNRFVSAALKDEDERVRAAAAIAVGKLGISAMIPRLIEMLETPSRVESHAALEGLEAFLDEGNSFGMDAQKWRAWHDAH